ILAMRAEPLGAERDAVLAVLHREDRRARGDLAEHGDLLAAGPMTAAPPREDERAGRALVGHPPLEHSLLFERAQMVDRRTGREAEALADLPHRGRHAVALGKAPHEVQDLALPPRHLPHPGPSSPRIIVNTR